jgi:hypothetical protein
MTVSVHKYVTGEEVEFANAMSSIRGTKTVSILKLLPPLGTVLQYRVRDGAETYDRVVPETALQKKSSLA